MNHLMAKMYTAWQLKKDEGATAVEYGLLVSLIAVAIIATVYILGDNLDNMFGSVATEVADAGAPAEEE
jgi:pilus assembly protein Flp/PilA